MSDPIAAFIEARYAEIQSAAENGESACWHIDYCDEDGPRFHQLATPAFILADVIGKRALIAALEDNVRHWSHDDHTRAAAETALEATRRHLAAPFAAHEDYLPGWSA